MVSAAELNILRGFSCFSKHLSLDFSLTCVTSGPVLLYFFIACMYHSLVYIFRVFFRATNPGPQGFVKKWRKYIREEMAVRREEYLFAQVDRCFKRSKAGMKTLQLSITHIYP